MRNVLLMALVAAMAAVPSAGGASTLITAPATITAVTVYTDRAQVTRTATVSLKPGRQVVRIDSLPVLLQDDSVHVEAAGTARATITGIEIKRDFLPQVAEKRVKAIDNELRLLESKLGGLDAQKAGLSAQKGFVDSIRVAWGNRISQQLAVGKPTAAELGEAMGFIGTNTVKVEELGYGIEQERRSITDRIDALRRQRQEVTGSNRKELKAVEVTLATSRPGNMTLTLTGVFSRATWEPSYDLRLSPDGSRAELSYRALVRQQTGEDWNNVSLTLSTAQPEHGGAPPELHPWRVSFYRPLPRAMPAAAPRMEAGMYSMARKAIIPESIADETMAKRESAPLQTAQASSEGASIAFTIPTTVDIPSDNTQHNTLIAWEQLPVHTAYVTVPKLSQRAYLTADLVNKAVWPLLPGTVKIFSGNNFVGSAAMRQVASGETFTLPFGSDDRIVVKREELKQHAEAGLFGGNRMGYRTVVTLSNLRKTAQTITIKDQLPLAADAEINVSLEKPTLQPFSKRDDGTLTWRLTLAPGEKKELSYEIIVEYPKGRELVGL